MYLFCYLNKAIYIPYEREHWLSSFFIGWQLSGGQACALLKPLQPPLFVDLTSGKCSVSLELICKMGMTLPTSQGEQQMRCHTEGAVLSARPAQETVTESVLI